MRILLALLLTLIALPAWAQQFALVGGTPATVLFGPRPWDPVAFNQELASRGDSTFPNGPAPSGPVKVDGAWIVPVTITPPKSLDPVTQQAQNSVPVILLDNAGNPNAISIAQIAAPLPAPQAAANQKALAASQFQVVLSTGVQVASSSQLSINATYAFDPTTRANIQAVILGVLAAHAGIIPGTGLPGGASTIQFPDLNQVKHTFDVPTFIAFALAVENYYYAVSQGLSPTQPVQIP